MLKKTLPPSTIPFDRLVSILEERQAVLATTVAGLRNAMTPDQLHDVRVACRRLRSAIRTFLPFLDGTAFSAHDKQLKRFMKKFNELRDLDVHLEQMALVRKPAFRELAKRISHIQARLAGRKRKAQKRLGAFLQGEKSSPILSLPPIAPLEHPGQVAISPTLLIPEVIEAGKRSAAVCWDEDSDNSAALHSLRIQIKRLRYGMETFLPQLGQEGSLLIKRLQRIQELLGRIHDGDILGESLKDDLVQDWKMRSHFSRKFLESYFRPATFSRNCRSLPDFLEMDLFLAVHFLFKHLSKKRLRHIHLAKRIFDGLERRGWIRSLKEWFKTGICPKPWSAEKDRSAREKSGAAKLPRKKYLTGKKPSGSE